MTLPHAEIELYAFPYDHRTNDACPVHRVPAEYLEKVLLAQEGCLFRTPAGPAQKRMESEVFFGIAENVSFERTPFCGNQKWVV